MIEKLYFKRPPLLILIWMSIFFVHSLSNDAGAQTVLWAGHGDAVSFEDASNWSPAGIPNLNNNLEITLKGAHIVASATFAVKSLSIGGKSDTTLSIEEFVSGAMTPEENTDIALHIKKGGEVVLKGAGEIRLTGSFKNTEATLINSPAFMFMAE